MQITAKYAIIPPNFKKDNYEKSFHIIRINFCRGNCWDFGLCFNPRIEFENNGTYKVWRGNEAQSNKIAPDPANPGQKLKDVQLKRGIIAKANKKVIFDELGRVYSDQATTKSYEHKIDQNTTIKLCKGSASSDCTGKEHIKLSIEPETGYILPEHCGAANKDGFSSCKVLDI